MSENFISVTEASKRYGYSDSHIRNLLIKGLIEGQKFASVWMVDARSLERYKVRMEQLGRKKHGLRPVTPTEFTLSTVEGLSADLSHALSPVEGEAEGPGVPMTARAALGGDSS